MRTGGCQVGTKCFFGIIGTPFFRHALTFHISEKRRLHAKRTGRPKRRQRRGSRNTAHARHELAKGGLLELRIYSRPLHRPTAQLIPEFRELPIIIGHVLRGGVCKLLCPLPVRLVIDAPDTRHVRVDLGQSSLLLIVQHHLSVFRLKGRVDQLLTLAVQIEVSPIFKWGLHPSRGGCNCCRLRIDAGRDLLGKPRKPTGCRPGRLLRVHHQRPFAHLGQPLRAGKGLGVFSLRHRCLRFTAFVKGGNLVIGLCRRRTLTKEAAGNVAEVGQDILAREPGAPRQPEGHELLIHHLIRPRLLRLGIEPRRPRQRFEFGAGLFRQAAKAGFTGLKQRCKFVGVHQNPNASFSAS